MQIWIKVLQCISFECHAIQHFFYGGHIIIIFPLGGIHQDLIHALIWLLLNKMSLSHCINKKIILNFWPLRSKIKSCKYCLRCEPIGLSWKLSFYLLYNWRNADSYISKFLLLEKSLCDINILWSTGGKVKSSVFVLFLRDSKQWKGCQTFQRKIYSHIKICYTQISLYYAIQISLTRI